MYKTKTSYEAFLERIEKEIVRDSIIENNQYCHWFREADLSANFVRDFTIQFSVFSNLCLVAELKKMLNSHSLEYMRSAKEIFLTELGALSPNNSDKNMLTPVEWILQFAKPLDLRFSDLGKRKLGTPSTLFFCGELERLYGSEEYSVAAGASYAFQTWAVSDVWDDLHTGLLRFKNSKMANLELGFFTWHNKEQEQYLKQTQTELAEAYFDPDFFLDEDLFMRSAKEMMKAIAIFWDGLYTNRIVSEYRKNS